MDLENERQNFCHNVCNLRKKYHLSKKSMALLLGISMRSLRLIESGIVPNCVTVCILIRLHQVFDLSIDSLFAAPPEEQT